MAGGNIGSGVILDLSVLDGCPLEVNREGKTARTGSGVTLRALQAAALRAGLRLPPDPSSARFATLGGMASTNAAGPSSVAKGSVRRWIRSLELVTADGELLSLQRGAPPPPVGAVQRFLADAEPMLRNAADLIHERFPKVRKNSSGYALDAWLASGDLLDLFIGSEGTLGVITEIGWILEPIPAQRGGLLVGIRSLPELSSLVPDLLELAPAALEFLDASLLRFVESRSGIDRYTGLDGLLMMEFETEDPDTLEARIAAATALLSSRSVDLHVAMDSRSLDRLWGIRQAASPLLASMGESKRSLQVIEDACVSAVRIAEYVQAVRAAGTRHGMDLVIFGHFGDGNVHVNLQPDIATPDWEARIRAIFEEITETVVALGGTLTGEHGDGRLRAPMLEKIYGPEVIELFRVLKRAFDPDGILNPGIILPAPGSQALEPLKVGVNATAIPDPIELALRDIERTAAYSVSRLELSA